MGELGLEGEDVGFGELEAGIRYLRAQEAVGGDVGPAFGPSMFSSETNSDFRR